MNRKKKSHHQVLWKYRKKQPLTQREEDMLYKWVSESTLHQQLFDELSNDDYWQNEVIALEPKENTGDADWNVIGRRLDDIAYFEDRPGNSRKKYMLAAAILLVLVTAIMFLYFDSDTDSVKENDKIIATVAMDKEVQPAAGMAVLQLGDGSIVSLDQIDKKMPGMERYGMFISVENGSLVYRTDQSVRTEDHKLITPRAAQYKIVLPDGTQVWLNAASSLKFPTSFNENERIVELKGEGYFEVAKNKEKPFKVKVPSSAQGEFEIKVLGTHFNINAYEDNRNAATTLLEGSVIVKAKNDSVQLTPGQKAILDGDADLRIAKADLAETIAWKDKLFMFNNQPIPEIMGEIERWYDVKVVFKGNITEKFTGILPRDLTLGQILTVLDKGGSYSFEVKDKTVTVSP